MPVPAEGDGLPASSEELEAALAAFAGGPWDDAAVLDAVYLVAVAAAYLEVAARQGGLTAVDTVCTVTTCLAMTADDLQPLLIRAGDWLGTQVTAGRLAAGRPLTAPAFRARESGAVAADCAAVLYQDLRACRELTARMLGFEADFTASVPYDDVDTVRAAWTGAQAARYLAAAVEKGCIAGPATLAALTAGLAAAARRMEPLLAWLGDWLSREVTAGRVTGARRPAELAADTRAALETAAGHAARLARVLQDAHELATAFRPAG